MNLYIYSVYSSKSFFFLSVSFLSLSARSTIQFTASISSVFAPAFNNNCAIAVCLVLVAT